MFAGIPRLEIIMVAGPAIFLLIVLEMVRRRRLREDYSLLWLGTFGILFVLSLFSRSLLDILAHWMGIAYPPTALFVIGFGLLLLVMLQFSTVITRLARENRQAAQHIAMLSARVKELENALGERDST